MPRPRQLDVTLSETEIELLLNAVETWEPFHSPLRTQERRLCVRLAEKFKAAQTVLASTA